ncbi:MAG: response regulator [Candidatus Omnitrophica bacterium]|nr:response regulator [Candidatus Omnitrophota bacterium]
MHVLLVVDDEPEIRLIMEKFFAKHGFSVLSAEHGGYALEIIQSHVQIDCILLDMKMPKVDGFAVLTQLRQIGCAIPIILIGGSVGAENDIVKLQELGFQEEELLYKPISLDKLLEIVKSRLNII